MFNSIDPICKSKVRKTLYGEEAERAADTRRARLAERAYLADLDRRRAHLAKLFEGSVEVSEDPAPEKDHTEAVLDEKRRWARELYDRADHFDREGDRLISEVQFYRRPSGEQAEGHSQKLLRAGLVQALADELRAASRDIFDD